MDLTADLDKLSLLQLNESDLDDPETWLFSPSGEDKTKTKEEEENLEKWLKGAVEKVDYRTRSALSRRLEKKKKIRDKEKRRNNMESSLSMIEEVSSESGPLSDREQPRRPREKENMVQRKCISEASVDSNDDEDDEDEEYFDAPSTPKKLPFNGRNPSVGQQSPRKMRNGNGEGSKNAAANSSKNAIAAMPKRNIAQFTEEAGLPKEWRNLSDIERRAREQEKELKMELMKRRHDRLSDNNSSRGEQIQRSRPGSASSSTSSVISGNGSHAHNTCTMATSKSVDFRTNTVDQLSVTSSRSNEGSLADLSANSTSDQFGNQPLNSRLPLPRRPTIPGKTGIPLPAPKRTSRKISSGNLANSPPADPAPMNDDECF